MLKMKAAVCDSLKENLLAGSYVGYRKAENLISRLSSSLDSGADSLIEHCADCDERNCPILPFLLNNITEKKAKELSSSNKKAVKALVTKRLILMGLYKDEDEEEMFKNPVIDVEFQVTENIPLLENTKDEIENIFDEGEDE